MGIRLRSVSPLAWVSAALFLASLGAVIALVPVAASNDAALGKHKLAFFIPPFAAMLFLTLHETAGRRLARPLYSILFMLALMLPLLTLWNQGLVYRVGDDPYDYSRHAHYMASNGTWEGEFRQKPFTNQVLIRYVFAGEFLLLGGEKVALQMLNLVIFFSTLTALYFRCRDNLSQKHRLVLVIGLLLITPYSSKNVLAGFTEWLALTLVFGFLLLRDHRMLSHAGYACLGLATVARMNLLPAAFLLFGLEAARRRASLSKFVVLIAMVSFPLVHNGYFYGAWTYLPEGRGWPVQDPEGLMRQLPAFADFVGRRALLYSGYPFTTYDQYGRIIDGSNGDWLSVVMGTLFLPYFVCAIACFVHLLKGVERLWYLAAAAVLAGPTLLLGNGSWPRFQYVTVVILFACYFAWTARSDEAGVEPVRPLEALRA